MVRARCKAGHDFYIWGRLQGVAFVVSFLALQECYHRSLFGAINDAARKAGHKDWKDYRRDEPAAFAASAGTGRALLANFQAFFASSGLKVMTFGTGHLGRLLMREPRVARYARTVLEHFDVDTMDAFHYALMRRARINAAASNDADWHALPYGVVISL